MLAIATADGRHRELVDACAKGAARFLEEHRGDLRDRFPRIAVVGARARSTIASSTRSTAGSATFLQQVIDDPSHELRQHLDRRLADLVTA